MEHISGEKNNKHFECFQIQVFMPSINFRIHNAMLSVRKTVIVEDNMAGTIKSTFFFVQVHPTGSNQAIANTSGILHVYKNTKVGTLCSPIYLCSQWS